MQVLTRTFKAFSDETRLSLVALLTWEPSLCVCDFMEVLDIPQPSVSRHMKILADAGVVEGNREGVWVHYRLLSKGDQTTENILNSLAERFAGKEYDELRGGLHAYLAKKNTCCGLDKADAVTTAE